MLFLRSKSLKKYTDEELVERYASTQKNDYVAELFNRYTVMVYGVCMKYLKDEDESKDATMQIFEKLIADLPKHQVRTFKPWLHMVTRNHCLMKLRKDATVQMVRVEENEYGDNGFVESGEDVHLTNEAFIKEEKYNQLEQAVESLSEEQRQCIELFFYQKKCYEEIVEITGFNYKQVKSYIQNGKRNLRISLNNING
jgi:RNA polymerase sigma factor (sigma-70 family)